MILVYMLEVHSLRTRRQLPLQRRILTFQRRRRHQRLIMILLRDPLQGLGLRAPKGAGRVPARAQVDRDREILSKKKRDLTTVGRILRTSEITG